MPTSFTTVSAGEIIASAHINQFAGDPPATESPINRLELGKTWYGEDATNTGNYAVTLDPAPGAYTAGMLLHFKVANGNTGPVTLNVNGLGAQNVVLRPGQALVGGELVAGQVVFVVHDGADFQLLNPTPPPDGVTGTGAAGQVATWTGAQTVGGSNDLVWDSANGRLGIGTNVPNAPLAISGTTSDQAHESSLRLDAAYPGITFYNAGTSRWLLRNQQTNDELRLWRQTGTAGAPSWSTLVSFDHGNGRVGIGVTGPSYQLHLSQDSAAKPSTNTWTVSSDGRCKRNLRPYRRGLEVLERLEPVEYEYNGLGGTPEGLPGVGVVAQEVRELLPGCVRAFRRRLRPEDTDEVELLGFNSHEVTWLLVNGVKELARRLERLEGALAAEVGR